MIREFTDDYVRERIKDDSFDEALEVCDGITKLGRALAELRATVEIEEDIPILGITKGTYDVQRFLHWNVMKCFWNDDFDFFTNNIVNVDWYHPVYCFRYTPEEFRVLVRRGLGDPGLGRAGGGHQLPGAKELSAMCGILGGVNTRFDACVRRPAAPPRAGSDESGHERVRPSVAR